MPKVTLITAVFCCLSAVVYPQDGPDDLCTVFCVQVRDYSCSNPDNCGAEDCESFLFTAPCHDQTYILKCDVVCSSGNCVDCMAYVCVTDGASQLAFCGTNDTDDCDGGCAESGVIMNLVQNREYKLYACLYHCTFFDCDDCENCYATATLYRSGATCPNP